MIVHTYHAALKDLLIKKDANPCLLRWILLLQEFDLEIKDKKGIENGVADHLSRMKIVEETVLDDSLPEEQVYAIGRYVENRQDTLAVDCSADCSANCSTDCSADCSADPKHFVAAIKKRYSQLPWFAEIANFLAAEKELVEFTGNEKRKFLRDAKLYFWDEPFLYQHCKDGVFRRCVPETEIPRILDHCHGFSYAGHFASFKTISKVLQAGFWWPTMFRDAQAFISKCNSC